MATGPGNEWEGSPGLSRLAPVRALMTGRSSSVKARPTRSSFASSAALRVPALRADLDTMNDTLAWIVLIYLLARST